MPTPSPTPIPCDAESDCLMAYSGPDLSPVFSLEVANDIFLFGAHNGLIRGFYIDDPFTACELVGHKSIVRGMVLSERGNVLHSASKDGTVKTWDMQTKEEEDSKAISAAGVDCVQCSKSHVLCGTADGFIAGWKADSPPAQPTKKQAAVIDNHDTLSFRIKAHVGNIASMVVDSPTASQISVFTTSNDGTAKHIDITTGKLVAVYEGCGPLRSCLLEPESQAYYVSGSHKNIFVYDVRCAVSVGQLRGHSEAVTGMALSAPNPMDAAVQEDAQPAAAEVRLPRSSQPALAQAASGLTMYSASEDSTVIQWDLRTGAADYAFHGHSAAISCIKFTQAGQLFTGSFDSSVRIWDVQSAFERVQTRQLMEKDQNHRAEHLSRDKKDRDKSSSKKKSKDKKKSKEKTKESKDSSKKKSGKKKKKK